MHGAQNDTEIVFVTGFHDWTSNLQIYKAVTRLGERPRYGTLLDPLFCGQFLQMGRVKPSRWQPSQRQRSQHGTVGLGG
jgi:hypothetical protein